MYYWGKFTNEKIDEERINKLYLEAQSKIANFEQVSIEEILSILDQVGQYWKNNHKFIAQVKKTLEKELDFSPEMIGHSLSLIPNLLNKNNLRLRLKSELNNISQLDQFVQTSNYNGKIRARSLGVLTHYSAGNVFLGILDSLIMGLITKNINIIKLSSGNHSFPEIFLKTLLEVDIHKKVSSNIAVIYWKGGIETIEKIVKSKSNGIMAWGGEEMVSGLKSNLPSGTKLIDYGPKISFSIISKKAYQNFPLKNIAQKIAYDLTLWDQAACASPQNLFIEEGIDEKKLMNAIANNLKQKNISPRGKISKDENVELLKENFKAKTNKFKKQGGYILGEDFFLHYENYPELRNSPLNRTLIIKKFKDLKSLEKILTPNLNYLQSCSYLLSKVEEQKFCEVLSRSGVKRFSELGTILFGKLGAPHDGRLTLVELLRFIPIENNHDLLKIAIDAKDSILFYQKKYNGLITDFKKIPLLNSTELSNLSPSKDFTDGHIFSSGGTSGAPKYSYYSSVEFNLAVKMISQGLQLQGLKAGDKVANLFVAGNLWSSFIAIEKALEELKTIQLSIGGLTEKELMISYLKKFKPTVLVGLPTLLIDLAEVCHKKKIKLPVGQIYYAGEKMPAYALSLFKKVFSCSDIRSAGYASVDAGPIGYQCQASASGEHHLFSDFIHLEVIENEAVVTTKYREIMPVIRLKTGDRVELISLPCCCGSSDPKFLLLGRNDNLINIWGCRLQLKDIETTLSKNFGNSFHYQLQLRHQKRKELMTILVESSNPHLLNKKLLWNSLKDLKQTHSFDYFAERCEIVQVKSIARISRTGKMKKIIDER